MLPDIKEKIICLLLFFCAATHSAQNTDSKNTILFSTFFAEKNLSSHNITCFFQDSKGYMWIGTEDGLNYFNGKTIKVFKHDHLNKNSLPDNLVGSVCEDAKGYIWIGTSQGISRLDPELFNFLNFLTDAQDQSLGYKVNISVDKENNIWAFSNHVFRLNRQKNNFEKINFKNAEHPTDKIYSGIFQDSKKRYWLSSNENLYRFFPETNSREAFTHFKRKVHFFPVKEDLRGNLFSGTWADGLYKINADQGSLDTIENKGLRRSLSVQRLNGKDLLWCGNWLSTYDLYDHSFVRYSNEKTNPYSCKNSEISALFTDAQNQLWIGYVSKGIQIVSPSNQAFKTFLISEKEGMFPIVNCFIKTKNYSYAGGWYNYSLARLDKENKPVKVWKTLISQYGYGQEENNLSDAWDDHKGNIWFTGAYGLIKFNEATEKAELFKLDTSVAKRTFFLQMLPEGDSVLWLSGYFCGLSRFSIKTKKFQNWGADIRSLYWGITKDNSGILWLADNSGVLTGFNPKTKTFITKNYNSLTEGVIYNSIVFDSINNTLWVTSGNGLLRIDRNTFKAKLFTEKDNLPTCQVNSVQFDAYHRLWIATNKGLCFYDPEQNTFKTFFSNNGLPENVLSQMFKIQPGGDLYIGCRDGFSVLKTSEVHFEKSLQSVSIAKAYESGNIIPIQLINKQKTIELNYDENNIQIEFSSNDLINSEDNQLIFRLDGFDKSWNMAQNGIVNYSKLSPGKYIFHAGSIDHNGIRAERDDFLTVIIRPPFWKTAWFISLNLFLLFVLTLLAARYVFTRNLREKILILEKEQAIEKERSRISQDMHDELGSGLTKISIMSEVAKTQLNDSSKTISQLENISSSSRELVDNLQDIIWILNSRNDSLENLCSYLREYTVKYFEPVDMNVQIDFPEKISALKLSEDQRRNVLLVFKETFNNISKHSESSLVTVKMEESAEYVSFTVSDNGKGFDKQKVRNFANGLHNMEKRMSHIKGSFIIDSSSKGTTSHFKFAI